MAKIVGILYERHIRAWETLNVDTLRLVSHELRRGLYDDTHKKKSLDGVGFSSPDAGRNKVIPRCGERNSEVLSD
jgi:hypothetical protein